MILDKKTTYEISTEEDIRTGKVWVSQESLIKMFEDDSITCFEDLRDIVLSELKGEK